MYEFTLIFMHGMNIQLFCFYFMIFNCTQNKKILLKKKDTKNNFFNENNLYKTPRIMLTFVIEMLLHS